MRGWREKAIKFCTMVVRPQWLGWHRGQSYLLLCPTMFLVSPDEIAGNLATNRMSLAGRFHQIIGRVQRKGVSVL
jgi:hypothetical protein